MLNYFKAIIEDDVEELIAHLSRDPRCAKRTVEKDLYIADKIFHWLYKGDTLLHLAAAGHRSKLIGPLLAIGLDPNSNKNRRKSTPFHYAADASLNESFDSSLQLSTLRQLVDAGAHLNAQDKNGASALHRAVRTRAAAAVEFLLNAGADPHLMNSTGSTAFHLAVQTTGRGGSGTPQAKEAQIKIIESFMQIGISSTLRDGRGKTVYDSAQSVAVRALLER